MSKLSQKFRQWLALEAWERRLLLKLLILLPMSWVVLRLVGFNRARSLAECNVPSGSAKFDQGAMERAQRHAQLASIAARYGIYKANCLHQSLTLCRVLRKRGMPVQIRIGVRPDTKPFEAHAWVELNGVPLGQSVDQYKAFDRLVVDPDTTKFI